jgi:hypothetical protein
MYPLSLSQTLATDSSAVAAVFAGDDWLHPLENVVVVKAGMHDPHQRAERAAEVLGPAQHFRRRVIPIPVVAAWSIRAHCWRPYPRPKLAYSRRGRAPPSPTVLTTDGVTETHMPSSQSAFGDCAVHGQVGPSPA